ncbi:MAG: hypothetical protein CMH81_07515 [Nitrospiraceae bacterium]|nr:hypothetical protein [Nitrospiraceae bacterium]
MESLELFIAKGYLLGGIHIIKLHRSCLLCPYRAMNIMAERTIQEGGQDPTGLVLLIGQANDTGGNNDGN